METHREVAAPAFEVGIPFKAKMAGVSFRLEEFADSAEDESRHIAPLETALVDAEDMFAATARGREVLSAAPARKETVGARALPANCL